jgi:hypothetical protein
MTLLEHFAIAIKAVEAACGLKPVIRARFEGVQPWPGCDQVLELWTLEETIPGHPAGSTVSRETIQRAGYALPNVKRS